MYQGSGVETKYSATSTSIAGRKETTLASSRKSARSPSPASRAARRWRPWITTDTRLSPAPKQSAVPATHSGGIPRASSESTARAISSASP